MTPKYPHILHGGDYNPDQWIDYPEIVERDIELMNMVENAIVRYVSRHLENI